MKKLSFKGTLALLFSLALLSGGTAFSGPGGSFIHKTAAGSYEQTISSLKRAVSGSGMMIAGEIDQKQILSMAGLNLQGAHTFFVGNPMVGKKLFEMNPAAGIVLPVRIFVWVNQSGKTEVGYFKLSEQLATIDSRLKGPGEMLDQKFEMIINAATH